MNPTNPTKLRVEAELCRRNFYTFVKKAYPFLGVGEYVDGWHIDLLTRGLTYLYKGDIKSNSLYINVPPGHMKSLLCAVMYPLWVWTKDPTKKFMLLSYADTRALQDSNRRRVLFGSEWYQQRFPLTLREDNQARQTNIYGGSFYSTGIAGQITGEHCDYEILDDILNGEDRYSEPVIKKMTDVYDNLLPSRFNDTKIGKKVIICQRLSDKDIIGHIEETKEPFEKIILPEMNDGFRYTSKFADLNDPRSEGELLWAEKFDLPTVMKLQYSMSSLDIAGQFQQRPQAVAGNVYKREWFKNRFENTDIVWRFLFIDSASSLRGDYTSILCAEVMSDYRIFIRDVYRGKLEFSDLIREIKRLAAAWHYNLHGIVIEEKSSGIQAVQVLRESADTELASMIVSYIPKGSKIERATIQSVWCEKERIILPPPGTGFSWLLPFEDEIFSFPNGAHDDQTDTFSMCIEYLSNIIEDGYNATMTKQEIKEDIYA
jgi:predicted phage terminase large subunit-like protein